MINLFPVLLIMLLPLGVAESNLKNASLAASYKDKVVETLHDQVLAEARWALKQEPITITATVAKRSAGGRHDFYSEGDYWWLDPENPDGPYIRKDGMTNPANFVAHRLAMIRFSRIIGALASAYEITGEAKYVDHAFKHLAAWFLNDNTLMNPSLNYAQAISGRVTGRGIGIIDTIHLMEVAQGVRVMADASGVDKRLVKGIKNWFSQYLKWLTTHEYGLAEMNAKNNHGTCWVMQVAAFASLTENREIMDFCRERYKKVLLPKQMGQDGSFPLELERTKPYGYSLFNLDALTMVVHILSDSNNNLWEYETPDGRSIKKGIEFLHPYIENKDQWPYQQDVMYWENWPVAHPFLILGAEIFQNEEWFSTWAKLDHSPRILEIVRNLPVRNPIIWFNPQYAIENNE